MKKAILFMLTMAGVVGGANAQTALTQSGYSLKCEYTVPGIVTNQGSSRQGIAIKDKIYVNVYGQDKILIYDKTGNKTGEIVTPKTGDTQYHNWVGLNVDEAGHLLVQVDKNAFSNVGGMVTPGGGHGIMIIDTDKDEVMQSFVEFGGGSSARFDAMAPVMKDITKDYNVRIINTLGLLNTENAYQQSFNQNTNGVTEASFWKVAAFKVANLTDLLPEGFATTTGYALEYMPVGKTASNLAMYYNVEYKTTYSAEGKYGNSIMNFTGNWTWDQTFFYTPMHSGWSAFNIFTIGDKQYMVYPSRNPSVAPHEDNRPSDAFAISEVSFVNSPVTDMTMEGENLVSGKPAGKLLAVFPGTGLEFGQGCVPSYTIEKVEGDENSVYIYVYSTGAPVYKWKFTVGDEGEEPEQPEEPVEPAPDPEPAQALLTQDGVTLTQMYQVDASITAGSRSGVGMNDRFYVPVFSNANTASKGVINVYNAKGELIQTIEPTEGYQIWPNTNVDDAGNVIVMVDNAAFLPNAKPTATSDTNIGRGMMILDSETAETLNPLTAMGGGWPTRYDGLARISKNIMESSSTNVFAVLSGGTSTYQSLYNKEAKYNSVAGRTLSGHLTTFQAVADGAEAATAQTTTGLVQEYVNTQGNLDLAVYPNYKYKSTYSADKFYGNAIAKYTVNGWSFSNQYFYTPMHANMPGFTVFTLDGKEYIIYPANSIANRASRLGDGFVITEVTYVNTPLTDIEAAGEKFVGEGTINPESPVMAYYAGEAAANSSNDNIISYTVEPIYGQDNSVYIYVYCAGAPVNKWRFTVGTEEELPVESVVITEKPTVTLADDKTTFTISVPYRFSDALLGHAAQVTVDDEHYGYFRPAENEGSYDIVLPYTEETLARATAADHRNIKIICRSASATYDVPTAVININVDTNNAPVEYYNLQGIRVERPVNGGIYIVKQGDTAKKVVM